MDKMKESFELAAREPLGFRGAMDSSDADAHVIPSILFSDGLIREAGTGKITLIGMFGAWNCPSFPFDTPPFWGTIVFANLDSAIREINIVLKIEQKKTGIVLWNAGANIKFDAAAKFTRNDVFEIPFQIPSIRIPNDGEYRAVAMMNDEWLGERPLTARLIQMPTSI